MKISYTRLRRSKATKAINSFHLGQYATAIPIELRPVEFRDSARDLSSVCVAFDIDERRKASRGIELHDYRVEMTTRRRRCNERRYVRNSNASDSMV